MLVIEEEALGKYCLKWREQEDRTRQIPFPLVGWGRCVGSGCMAWRWHDALDTSYADGEPTVRGAERLPLDQRRGYCGLAGVPNHE